LEHLIIKRNCESLPSLAGGSPVKPGFHGWFHAGIFVSDAAGAATVQKLMAMKAAMGTRAKSPRSGRPGLSFPNNRN